MAFHQHLNYIMYDKFKFASNDMNINKRKRINVSGFGFLRKDKTFMSEIIASIICCFS